VKHSDGYLVQVANRQYVEYVEPHRKAMIEVDFAAAARYFKAAEFKKFAASLGNDNVKNDIIANDLMLG
jgi:hypothetical protein